MSVFRTSARFGFVVLKVGVFVVVAYSVLGFLAVTSKRVQIPQPIRSVAVIALAVSSALPFMRAVDGVAAKVLRQKDPAALQKVEATEPEQTSVGADVGVRG
jgi:hypothetical protein